MNVREIDDAAGFLEEAGPLLLADEARNNLVLGIAGTIASRPGRYAEKRFWIAGDEAGPAAAALQTPPYNVVLAGPANEAVLAALAAGIDADLPGVVGGRPEADSFARLWADAHPIRPRVLRSQGVYALEQVQPVPAPPGTSRRATARDEQLLLDWMVCFAEEVLDETDPGRLEAQAAVRERLGSEHGGFVIWEDGGQPVSISGWGGPTPNGVRIGPVYTPPRLRGRGYATALVAGLSQQLLDAGRRFCFLFTDLANPTSNAIYERIGYVRACESAMIAFERRNS